MNKPTIAQSLPEVRVAVNAPGGSRSERGIALIVVLLLMAVLSGLATGFAMTGNVEVQMATNEVYYAGARAAAEAGLNRAIVEIVANHNTNFLSGTDGAVDDANPTNAVNADNGKLTFLLGGVPGPYALDAAGQYTYDIEILDDDDPILYEDELSDEQIDLMGETPRNSYINRNDLLILRAIGYGPSGTVVRLARMLETVDKITTTPTQKVNPAIVVNGDFEMNGNITVQGYPVTDPTKAKFGSVHANGNLHKTGTSGTVTGSATASGSYTTAGGFDAGGEEGGGRATITVPDILASDYEHLADFKLVVEGGVGKTQVRSGANWVDCGSACKNNGWSYSAGEWSTDKTPTAGTYYVEGNVDIGPTSGEKSLSVVATGDIRIHGNAKLSPENDEKVQFVTGGDLMIDNGSDIDPPIDLDGQILVRGQFDAGGNMEFQGRVMVQDVPNIGDLVEFNKIHGSVKFSYSGSLDAIDTAPLVGPTTYTNNISGWMEQ